MSRPRGKGNRIGARRRLALWTQREVICNVMLSAAKCGTWLTLKELARLTRYGEASISAQLRHLRKPRYGAFVIAKRPREGEVSVCLVHGSPVWEYRLSRHVNAVASGGRRSFRRKKRG